MKHKILVVDDGTDSSKLIFDLLNSKRDEGAFSGDIKIFQIQRSSESGLNSGEGIKEFRGEPSHLAEFIDDTTILLVHLAPVSKRVIDNGKELRLIGSARSSLPNIDINTARERNIPILYCPGRNAQSVAEFSMGMILDLVRHISSSSRIVKEQKWDADFDRKKFSGIELNKKILGIIGFGDIGKSLAQIAKGFGMNVIYYDPYISDTDNEFQGRVLELPELLAKSDIISLNAKSQNEKPIIGRDELALMKKGTYIINTARGNLIDEDALYEYLASGYLAGAALDVFREEPLPKSHKFFELDNILLTPHLAGMTVDMTTNGVNMLVEDAIRFIQGDVPKRIFKR